MIIETEFPKVLHYWNIQLNDPYFNAIEYVYRMSSLNASTARISADGKLRAVMRSRIRTYQTGLIRPVSTGARSTAAGTTATAARHR